MRLRLDPFRNSLLPMFAVAGALAASGFVLASETAKVNPKGQIAAPIYWVNREFGKEFFNANDRIWYKGVKERREVSLTFDDGPHDDSCVALLDTLKEKGVHATFFVVGKQVDKYPELVARMIDEGHEVGNHTYDHFRLVSPDMTKAKIREQLDRCDEAIIKACGRTTTLFRPPGMRFNRDVIDILREKDQLLIYWTIGARDFIGTAPEWELTPEMKKEPVPSPADLVERVKKQLKPGAIILLHDNPITTAALGDMIDAIHAEGYQIKLCREMMQELPQNVRVVSNPLAPHISRESR